MLKKRFPSRNSSLFFYAFLIASIFTTQATTQADARKTNTNISGNTQSKQYSLSINQLREPIKYEFGKLPSEARTPLITAIESRPSGILDTGTYFIVGSYESDEAWGIGHLAAAIRNEPPVWESSIWYIVQKGGQWKVFLQGSPLFDEMVGKLPISLKEQVGFLEKYEQPTQITSNTFRFPWDKSQQWRYTFGWHGGTNLALDFAPVGVLPANNWVLASASGTITIVCSDTFQAAVDLTTPNGVMTYRHIDYSSLISQNLNNKAVSQGQKIATLYNGNEGEGYRDISTTYPWSTCVQGSSASCVHIQFLTYCGSGSGAHVHWTLPAKPFTVDGWQVDAAGQWTKSGLPNKNIGDTFTSTNSSSLLPSTFEDAPSDYWSWQYIESLYKAGITGGCKTSPLNYCPDSTVTRAQMAIFLLKSMHGASFSPPSVGNTTGFSDVATSYWAASWIKQLAAEGITGGCGGGNFCPDSIVTRAQMSVFLLKAKNNSSYTPPSAGNNTGFNDVNNTYWAAAFIKQLVSDGITSGCGSGNFCPDGAVTRAQMAVFIVKAFSLP